MNANELKLKLKELEANLQNKNVQEELMRRSFELDALRVAIYIFLEHAEQIEDEQLKTILPKVEELVRLSNEKYFSGYSHKFENTARYLINNTPVSKQSSDGEFRRGDDIKISEEEFSRRYNDLLEHLNFENEECNLILETPSEKKPFKVYKTKSKSLAVYAKSGEKPMTIAADRLLEVAFGKKPPTYTSYETVLISKIIDNSIFDFFVKATQEDLLEAMKSKILKSENELLVINGKLEEIEKTHRELSTTNEELKNIREEATNAREEFENAKTAAVEYAKLNASVSYWKIKQDNHKNKFCWFGLGAIIFIGVLIFLLFKALTLHESTINGDKQNVAIENFTKEAKEMISTSEIKEDNRSFDYSKLAWYAWMIFASSSLFWIIRITVKIALSNLHLSEDAHERVVMIQTYLSFIQEGQIDEKDKNIILSSLFRPANAGIIKDESSVTVADIVTAFKK